MSEENNKLSFSEALANLEKVYNETVADTTDRLNRISEEYTKLSEELSDIKRSHDQMHANNKRLSEILDEHEKVCEEIHTCHSYIQKLQDKNYGPINSANAGAWCHVMAKSRVEEAAGFAANAAKSTVLAEIEEYAAKADECAKRAAKDASDAVMFAKRAKERADELNTKEAAGHAYRASTYVKPTAELAAAAAKYAEEAARIAKAAEEAYACSNELPPEWQIHDDEIRRKNI